MRSTSMRSTSQERSGGGFTLVELSIIIIVIGVLVAFTVPRFLDSVERSKAGEAFNYLTAVRAAQERFQVRRGTFAGDIADLDLQVLPPKNFTVGNPVAGEGESLEDSWSLTLTRSGAAGGYGAYTVTFTDQGYDDDHSTIDPKINPTPQ